MRIVKDDGRSKSSKHKDEVMLFMYMWVVTCVDRMEDKPVVTLFKKKGPAQRCYEALKEFHPNVYIDKCTVYKDFYVADESQQIYLR